jgi:uncharacterized DUF497 family protein
MGERKNHANRVKHGVSFELAAEVFNDANRLVELNRIVYGEKRLHVIGMAGGSLLILFVAYTERNTDGEKTIRLISARKAGKKERRRYSSLREDPGIQS